VRNAAFNTLPRHFFTRDPETVGWELLGKLLVRRSGKTPLVARIVEVEAYLGIDDPAAHSASGRTARNAVLFGPPGLVYVYFIYGNHYCFNVSCLPDGVAGGVLVRALEPVSGIKQMARNRDLAMSADLNLKLLTSGPGRLAEAFGITRARDNGKDVTSRKSDLYIADDGFTPPRIATTRRIGIRKAVDLRLRYIVAGNRFVSGKKTLE
jgi:DNA-3-methyladenine glycosylase